jgi:integrase
VVSPLLVFRVSPSKIGAISVHKDGTMATIIKRPEGTYRVQIRRKGHKALSATFAKRQDAVDWAQKTEAALIERRFFPERAKHTLSEAIARYATENLPRYKPSTAEKKRQVLAWWEKRLGRVYLFDIDTSLISGELAKLPLAPATQNAYNAHLSALLTTAMRRWEWIPKVPKVDRFHIPKRRIRILNDDERTRLLASCKASHSPSLYAVVFTALTTGGRYKEILRLRWEDVDFNRGLITFWHTKNGRVRSVPMPDITKKVLQERERHGPRLFPQTTLWRAWDTARKRARLSDFRFHDLRHTFASYLAYSGASLFDIGELLGHRKMESTLIYAHMIEGHTRKVVDRMTEEFFSDRVTENSMVSFTQ